MDQVLLSNRKIQSALNNILAKDNRLELLGAFITHEESWKEINLVCLMLRKLAATYVAHQVFDLTPQRNQKSF